MDEPAATLGNILAAIATQTTRQALNVDPTLRARLHALHGRCIEVQCTLPAATWHLRINDGSINTVHGPAAAPQVIVRGAAIDLVRWFTSANGPGQVEISGDDTLLMELVDVLRDFNPDFASPLTQLLGADAATTLLGTAELGLKGLQSLIEGVGHSVQDQAAARFVQQGQLNSLLSGIDDLRLRVDRLAAKVAQREHERKSRR